MFSNYHHLSLPLLKQTGFSEDPNKDLNTLSYLNKYFLHTKEDNRSVISVISFEDKDYHYLAIKTIDETVVVVFSSLVIVGRVTITYQPRGYEPHHMKFDTEVKGLSRLSIRH